MKASELDKGMKVLDPSNPDEEDRSYYIPPRQIPVYKAYAQVGKVYERTIHDRAWDIWLSFVTANPVLLEQEIKEVIPQLYRVKDGGKEWLFYNRNMYGEDYKDNKHDFPEMEGFVEIPIFHYERDPISQKVISETTQVQEIVKKYTIPFTKSKVEELSKYFAHPLSCIVVSQNGTKFSCSLSEFRDMPYDELVNLKNGFTEFMRSRRTAKVYQ